VTFFLRYPTIPIQGARVLVTGAARGIGKAVAAGFVRKGAFVVAGDRDREALDAVAHSLGERVSSEYVDVTSRDSFSAFVERALSLHGRIDMLVNNAGVMPLGSFLEEPEAIGRSAMEVNLWGIVNGVRAVLPHMLARGQGHVLNVASMAGKIPVPGMAIYNASKFAAVGLTASLRRELAPSGISVSAVLPSAVHTDLVAGVPLGGGMPTVTPERVAEAVVDNLRTRRAEIAIPGLLAGWNLLDALTPEPVMSLFRSWLGERRALERIDRGVRGSYDARIVEQAHAFAGRGGERERSE
jgi:short-subunit dehydrogenase